MQRDIRPAPDALFLNLADALDAIQAGKFSSKPIKVISIARRRKPRNRNENKKSPCA